MTSIWVKPKNHPRGSCVPMRAFPWDAPDSMWAQAIIIDGIHCFNHNREPIGECHAIVEVNIHGARIS